MTRAGDESRSAGRHLVADADDAARPAVLADGAGHALQVARERGLDAWVLGSVGVLGEEDPADTLVTGTKGVHGGAVRLQGEYRTA